MEEKICRNCRKKKYLLDFKILKYSRFGIVLDQCKACYKTDKEAERKLIQKELKRRYRLGNNGIVLEEICN